MFNLKIMGQILNRIRKLWEAERNYDKTQFDNQDEDLKRIIDELNQVKNAADYNNENRKKEDRSKFESGTNSSERAYEILGLSSNASDEEIRAAYLKKIKEYHPDKVQNLGEEIRILAEKKTSEINQAYEYIKNIRNIK